MSAIPPTWLGSIIQSQGAQSRATERKSTEEAAQAERVGPGSFADRLHDVIEASDRDSQVYADAEGSGSQGRPFEESTPEAELVNQAADPPPDGLDIEA